jgi:hypothetical protein
MHSPSASAATGLPRQPGFGHAVVFNIPVERSEVQHIMGDRL